MRRITIIQGHPDPVGGHYGHALADAYRDGAAAGGHEVRTIAIATLDIALLSSKAEWEQQPTPEALRAAQDDIVWAEHLVFFYPLWLGTFPARLKAFLEQVLRPNLDKTPSPGHEQAGKSGIFARPLKGRSARIVVTMGMPALVYRFFFRAHSLRNFEGLILRFVGIAPARHTLIGSVEAITPQKRDKWLGRMRTLGRAGR